MPILYYLPDDRLITVNDTETILESSLYAGIPHTHACGGSARCSTCRVWVLEGLEYCAPRNDAEQALANRLSFAPKMRLACQTQVSGPGKITLRRLALDIEDLELIHQQMTSKGRLGAIGEEKQIAILFADLRGFTNFSEALPAYDVIYVLNRYFNHMGKIVERHGGVINNYMGDGCMALFGWDDRDRAAERAVRAAVDMQNGMVTINNYLDRLYHRQLQIGIGIHFGQVVLGAVGASAHSKQITAIGDAVNFASRIEAANKTVGTSLLISADTYALVKDLVAINRRCQVKIPGKSGEYLLYEVTNIAPSDEIERETAAPSAFRTLLVRFVKLLKTFQRRLSRLFH